MRQDVQTAAGVSTGLKMKHVAANTIPKMSDIDQIYEECNSESLLVPVSKPKVKAKKMLKKHYVYLDQLINADYGQFKSKVAATAEFIPEHMIQVDYKQLGDRFLRDFDLEELVGYFDIDAWEAVKSVVDMKKDKSTCVKCNEYCLYGCVECESCFKWFHTDCLELDMSDLNISSTFKCDSC